MAIIYPGKIERENTITIDGYSSMKTLGSAIKDFGRFIDKKFHNGEGSVLISIVKDGISEYNTPYVSANSSEGGYFFEWEEVPCASRHNDLTGEIETKDANYYFVMRFFKQ